MKNLLLFSILSLFLFSCGKSKYYLTQGEIFKTYWHIKYKYDRDLGSEIYERLDSVDLSLNPFKRQSIIYKVNHNETVEVDNRFSKVFLKAQEIAQICRGYYDITCAPLINLWGFGYESLPVEIGSAAVDSLKQFVGYQKIKLEGKQIMKSDPRVQLNASSLAKGYAVDEVAALFRSLNVEDYLIEIGGEIRTRGKNPNGRPWSIEISQPKDDASGGSLDAERVVYLSDCALATSGNYRNFYIREGKKYAHTINPITGYPAESEILSASVLYPDCMTADAFATAFMAMGMEQASAIADSISGLDYLFIYADEQGNFAEKTSRGFEKYLPAR